MIKNFDEFINEDINSWLTSDELEEIEKYNKRREEARMKIQTVNTSHFNVFYMVKYTVDGTECWAYNVSNDFLYNRYISSELGYKSEDDFKKFVYSCFMKEKSNIVEYYQKNDGKNIEVISNVKWVLKPHQNDASNDWNSLKQWMKNTFNERLVDKRHDNRYKGNIDGGYERYLQNFYKTEKQFREEFERITDEYKTNPLLARYNTYMLNNNTVRGLRQRVSRSYRQY